VVEGRHANLRGVAEVRRYTEVEARDLGGHRAAPQVGVLDPAEQSEGHQSITSEFALGTA
jgi:hypothetical protein